MVREAAMEGGGTIADMVVDLAAAGEKRQSLAVSSENRKRVSN